MVEVEGGSERVGVGIEWAGGCRTMATIIRPVSSFESLSYYPELCERVRELASQGLDIRLIARRLDEEGYRSPRQVEGFGHQAVQKLMRRLDLGLRGGRRQPPQELLEEHEWWLVQLAARIGMPKQTLYAWVRHGGVRSRRSEGYGRPWAVWADEEELQRLRGLRELPHGYHAHRRWIELQGGDDRVPR